MRTQKNHTPFVIDTSKSQHTVFQPVSIDKVHLTDKFWNYYRELNQNVMLPAQYHLCEETGRIENFRRASGKISGPFKGMFFNDSDVYKWVEAAAWVLATDPDKKLQALLESVINEIADAQQSDGYLNTYFMFEREDQRWTNFDLHEMYCAGHLIQAAVAHYRATGQTKLLDVATRYADYLFIHFGSEADGKQFAVDGHPEIEMALVELYRATNQKNYLDLAKFFVDARGYKRLDVTPTGRSSSYYQDHIPFRQMKRLYGHSVRAVYLNCGAADIFAETGEPELNTALNNMWNNMVTRQMYITSGLGSRYEIEGFGTDYELPNGRAHTETCAGVGNFMLNWRMLLTSGESRFADLMELSLYNAILPGTSLDGKSYFYQNPLSDDGEHRRERWFTVACCPSNISRTLATLPGYCYTTSNEGVWVHLYGSNQADLSLPNGKQIKISQQTDYPWSGNIRFEIQSAEEFGLFLRKPGWSKDGVKVTINGKEIQPQVTSKNYLLVDLDWQIGDVLELIIPMPVQKITSHPFVVENQGRVALMRGPIVYCLENIDHSTDVRLISLPFTNELKNQFHPELLGGVVALHGEGEIMTDKLGWDEELYTPLSSYPPRPHQTIPIMAIPYYAWANREPGAMQVWIPVI